MWPSANGQPEPILARSRLSRVSVSSATMLARRKSGSSPETICQFLSTTILVQLILCFSFNGERPRFSGHPAWSFVASAPRASASRALWPRVRRRLPFVFGDFVVEHFLQGRLNDRTPDVRDGIIEGLFLSVIFQLAGRGLLRQSGIEIAPIDDDEV